VVGTKAENQMPKPLIVSLKKDEEGLRQVWEFYVTNREEIYSNQAFF
jgi:hypothetical protein